MSAGGRILHEDIPTLKISRHANQQALKVGRVHRAVHLPPPNQLSRLTIFNDEFIVGGAAGMDTRAHDYSAFMRQDALSAGDNALDQGRGRQASSTPY